MNTKAIVKAVVPEPIRRWMRGFRNQENPAYFADKSASATFTEIYRNNVWGGNDGEFYSGEGSDPEVSEAYIRAVGEFLQKVGPRTVIDIGCGDFRVASQIVDPNFKYIGLDVVPDLIEHHRETHANPNVEFRVLDAIADELPGGDVCLIRQVLQHLSNAEIGQILDKCRKYRYLIITEHYPPEDVDLIPNIDMPHGAGTRLSRNSAVCADWPPFNIGKSREIATSNAPDGSKIRSFLFMQKGRALGKSLNYRKHRKPSA